MAQQEPQLTLEGLVKRLFQQTQEQSQQTIERTQGLRQQLMDWYEANEYDRQALLEIILDHHNLLHEALDALEGQEHRRSAEMQTGIDDISQAGY